MTLDNPHYKYAPVKQYEVTATDDGNTDCDIVIEDPEERSLNDGKYLNSTKVDGRRNSRKQQCFATKLLNSLTTLEKVLFLLLFVLLLVIIIKFSIKNIDTKTDNSVPTTSVQSPSPTPTAHQSSLCLSRGCVKIADRVASSLDESVNPCENFYKFSCGGWEKNHPLPAGYPRWSTFSTLWQENQLAMKALLETNTTSPNPSERKAKSLYRACLNLDEIDKVGTKPLLDLIKTLGGWEILGTWNESNFDFNSSLKKFFSYGVSPIVGFGVGTDSKMPKQNILHVGRSGLIVGSRDYYINKTVTSDKILSAYLEFMTTVATLLGGDKNTSRSRMLELLNFEKELAVIMPSLVQSRDSQANYYKTDIGSLKNITPAVNWLDFIQSTFRKYTNISINEQEPVVVSSRDYMRNVSKIIYATPKRVLHNYFMWDLVSTFSDILGEEFRDAATQLKKVKYGANTNCIERWRKCVSVVDGVLGKELGKLFVQKHFNSKSKSSAQEMVVSIKNAFKENLEEVAWMDALTKQKATEKVNAVSDLIGFSDKILNQSYVDDEYKDLNFSSSGRYFDNILTIFKVSIGDSLKELRKPVIRDEWFVTPPTVNALYSPTKNVIVFPAGILQPPFYSSDAPKAINFGGIGVVVGHELTHGFDDQGSHYDASGILRTWWGNSTLKEFKKKTKCMADQYSKYKTNGLSVNGNLTLGENIADNGGLKFAYNAYQAWKEKHSDIELPSLNYTSDQLFFIGFAQMWCYVSTPEEVKNLIISDVHSPQSIRVLGTLSNSHHFSEAFGCPAGSPMNPKDKCRVW